MNPLETGAQLGHVHIRRVRTEQHQVGVAHVDPARPPFGELLRLVRAELGRSHVH